MQIQLTTANAAFIAEQVNSGEFQSADDAVNAIVARAKIEQDLLDADIDAQDLAAIEEGLSQPERGEVIPWENVRQELFRKYLTE